MKVSRALTIAGSDSGGGAGIQADLKTFQEMHVYGMSVLTAVTAQNTTGVQGVYPMTVDAVRRQIQSIGEDLPPDAIKTGMLFSAEIIEETAKQIRHFGWNQVVVDPVMVAKGGAELLEEEAIAALRNYLLPLAKIVTPNIPEAEKIANMVIKTEGDRVEAAKRILSLGPSVVVLKGGHWESGEEAIDLVYDGNQFYELPAKRIPTKNTHGTGCTFSAAITSELALGKTVKEAIFTAKQFIQAGIKFSLEMGAGHGPTNHWAYRRTHYNDR